MVALAFRGLGLTPMESLCTASIPSNFLVTSKAKPHLGFSREGLVAVAAILLKLGMTANHRPGDHELLKQILRMRSPC